jgi:hypothetical protein
MMDEFACPTCDSPSIVYPDSIDNDDRPIRCRGCGMILGTLAQFRLALQRIPTAPAPPVSGC